MCGIAGLIGNRQVNASALYGMVAVQSHRGPDGDGFWFAADGRVALGHRRLAILDLSDKGRQPMADSSGQFIITFNGEIYNYLEIREELRQLGHYFCSDSDTEVILEAYKEWNEACLDRFNGMFAFALYDQSTNRIFCARDRYGEKPFLFVHDKDFFAFASEYKALLYLSEVSLDYDEFRLLRSLHNASTGLDADRATVFRSIFQLKPAEKLILNVATLESQISKYWDVRTDSDVATLTEADTVSRFRDLLSDSVRIRMRSDVRVGSCLSGGLDSTAIVCLARGLRKDNSSYHCFTGRFPGAVSDEWEYAKEVAEQPGITSHVVIPTAQGFVDELPTFMWYNELPVGSSSQYAQWCVFRLAKENQVTVLLDGQGADELLGGYEQYFRYYVAALREANEADLLRRELPMIKRRYPHALIEPWRSLRDRLPLAIRHAVANCTGWGTSFLFGIRPNLARKLNEANVIERNKRFNALTSALYQDSFGKFLTTLLRYGDRNSMAHSREVRLPFCDHRLADFVFSLPPTFLMGSSQTKRLLRESMRGILPEKIRSRWNKQGFLPPQREWVRDVLFENIEQIVYDPSFADSSVWNPAWWRKALVRLQRGEGQLAQALWQLLMAESWKRYFIKRFTSADRISVFEQQIASVRSGPVTRASGNFSGICS
jgi:asparagine synthase (glutamine-hydrolysing)